MGDKMNNYDKISNGICPKCDGELRSSDITENNGFNKYCLACRIKYRFHDDPGPGAYSIISLKEDDHNNESFQL